MTDRQTVDKEPGAFRTISEVADELDVPQHVLRFWETRFSQIKPLKRGGGRRFYRPEDVDLIRGIRHLLYGEGYTIKGVQRILKEEGVRFVQQMGSGEVQPGAADVSTPDDWQDDASALGDEASDFPSVVRPLQYSAGARSDDVVASPPVAVWRGPELSQGQHHDVRHDMPPPPVRPDAYGSYDPVQAHDGAADALAGSRHGDGHGTAQQSGHGYAPHMPDERAGRASSYGAPGSWEADADAHALEPGAWPAGHGVSGQGEAASQGGADQLLAGSGAPMPGAPMSGGLGSGAAVYQGGGYRLSPAQRARLQDALAELLECRRLLSHARGELDVMD